MGINPIMGRPESLIPTPKTAPLKFSAEKQQQHDKDFSAVINELNTLNEKNGSKKAALFMHVKPDEDAIFSASALKDIIKKAYPDIEVDIFSGNDIPDKLKSHAESFKIIDGSTNMEELQKNKYDLAIAVDCSKSDMIGTAGKGKTPISVFNNAVRKIKIDHHASGDNFADVNLVRTGNGAESTAQIIMKLAEHMDVDVDPKIAEKLARGLMGDTGALKYAGKLPQVYNDCALLVNKGADLKEIRKNMSNLTPKEYKFLREAEQNVHFLKGGEVAFIIDKFDVIKGNDGSKTVPTAIKKRYGLTSCDTKPLFNLVLERMLDISGVKVAIKLTQESNGDKFATSGSIRSNSDSKLSALDVARILKDNACGHEEATGFNPLKGMKATKILQYLYENIVKTHRI